MPIVWDPVGWAKGWRPKPGTWAQTEIIETVLHRMLFRNGDFIRARNLALEDFFATRQNEFFLSFVRRRDCVVDGAGNTHRSTIKAGVTGNCGTSYA